MCFSFLFQTATPAFRGQRTNSHMAQRKNTYPFSCWGECTRVSRAIESVPRMHYGVSSTSRSEKSYRRPRLYYILPIYAKYIQRLLTMPFNFPHQHRHMLLHLS